MAFYILTTRKQTKCVPTLCTWQWWKISFKRFNYIDSTYFTKWKSGKINIYWWLDSFSTAIEHALNLLTSPKLVETTNSVSSTWSDIFRNWRFFLSCFLHVCFFLQAWNTSMVYKLGSSSKYIRLSWNVPFRFIENKPNRLQDSLPCEAQNWQKS